jgi:hypothetical protein
VQATPAAGIVPGRRRRILSDLGWCHVVSNPKFTTGRVQRETMGRLSMTHRGGVRIGGALAVGAALAVAGCEAAGPPHLSTLTSPDHTYAVRLSGHATRPWFFENWVRAEIYKQGALHVPVRAFYISGLLEPPFQDRFGPPEWLSRNVLRLPGSRAVPDTPPDSVVVRNTSTRTYRSVRIETGQDMCLIIDLEAQREQVLPMRVQSASGRSAWFDIVLEAGTAGEFLRGHNTFELPRRASAAYTFVVNVSDHGAEVFEAGGPVLQR